MSTLRFSEAPRMPRDQPRSRPTIRVDEREPEQVDPSHLQALRQGIEAERRGEIATDEEVRAAFARLRA